MSEQINRRCDQLFKMGMMFNGSGYIGNRDYNKDFNVSVVEIQCDTESHWNEKIAHMKTEIQKRIGDQ